ncbi:MAG: hypothetical protein MUF65_13300, partial [Rubritepida sp.]|nr:hypothetical protein [Rubritepida sp.]
RAVTAVWMGICDAYPEGSIRKTSQSDMPNVSRPRRRGRMLAVAYVARAMPETSPRCFSAF